MIIIKKKDKESIDRMLKRYKQKEKKTKQRRRLRDAQFYTKPSMKKRVQKLKAVYIQSLRDAEEKRS